MRITAYKVFVYYVTPRTDPRVVFEIKAMSEGSRFKFHTMTFRSQVGVDTAWDYTDVGVYPLDIDVKNSLLSALSQRDSTAQYMSLDHRIESEREFSTDFDADITANHSINPDRWVKILDLVQLVQFSRMEAI